MGNICNIQNMHIFTYVRIILNIFNFPLNLFAHFNYSLIFKTYKYKMNVHVHIKEVNNQALFSICSLEVSSKCWKLWIVKICNVGLHIIWSKHTKFWGWVCKWIFTPSEWSFSSQLRTFHSHGDVTIAGEGLQILTYARHLYGNSALRIHTTHHTPHTHTHTHTHTYCRAFGSGAITSYINDLRLSWLEFKYPTFRLRG